MNIIVTKSANKWFMDEVGLEKGDAVRFYGKIYGKTEVHDNYGVAMRVSQPNDVLARETIDGITYFIEKDDEWFFHGYDFEIGFDEKLGEVKYHFIEQ